MVTKVFGPRPTLRIDLQNDPQIPAGRKLVEQLVGAHLAADNEEELLHMVGVSISEINQPDSEHSLRVLVHAVYRAQSLIVALLDHAAEISVIQESSETVDDPPHRGGGDPYREKRLELWSKVRDSTS